MHTSTYSRTDAHPHLAPTPNLTFAMFIPHAHQVRVCVGICLLGVGVGGRCPLCKLTIKLYKSMQQAHRCRHVRVALHPLHTCSPLLPTYMYTQCRTHPPAHATAITLGSSAFHAHRCQLPYLSDKHSMCKCASVLEPTQVNHNSSTSPPPASSHMTYRMCRYMCACGAGVSACPA
jgi:hypothetical protein